MSFETVSKFEGYMGREEGCNEILMHVLNLNEVAEWEDNEK
jgi:hypothetical protein